MDNDGKDAPTPKLSRAAQEMGRKSAAVNKLKGSIYWSDLAKKRWAKSIKCSKCGKRVDKSKYTLHYVGHYTGGSQGDKKEA